MAGGELELFLECHCCYWFNLLVEIVLDTSRQTRVGPQISCSLQANFSVIRLLLECSSIIEFGVQNFLTGYCYV